MKVKLGFIGTGGMAGAHMRNLQTFDDIEFTAMCDVSEERAQGSAAEFGGNVYTDFREMYDKEDLDAVYICTPPFAHGEQERIACEQGIPMFIEKPIAADLEQAVIINEDVRRSGVITSVGYHWRYGGNAQHAKSLLEKESPVSRCVGILAGRTTRYALVANPRPVRRAACRTNNAYLRLSAFSTRRCQSGTRRRDPWKHDRCAAVRC